MKIGYARVSSREQNEARQVESLTAAGCEKIYIDKASGKNFDRPKYQEMIAELRAGDVVVLHSLDRLGRKRDEMTREWGRITRDIQADIIVLDMPMLNTTTSNNNITGRFVADLVFQVLSYTAEIERENTRKRQAEGIAIAKAQGKFKGAPKAINWDLFGQLYRDYKAGILTRQSEFAARLGVSEPTLRKHIKEYEKNLDNGINEVIQ